ncbi:MAG: phosphohydrolase, partial [Flavobacteriales bacterium]
SQLDVDRIDYLNRDSFYTGVSEGVIGGERILKMLEVKDDKLVVEEKAIYSIEKFLVARRLMYWQVYLHKTVVACEMMLVETLRRAKELALQGTALFASPALMRFLATDHDRNAFADPAILADFLKLDDHDIMGAVKVWCDHPDVALSHLAGDLVHRRNLRIRLQEEPWEAARVDELRKRVAAHLRIDMATAERFVITGSIVNNAYDPSKDRIELLYKDGSVRDIAEASDNLGIAALSTPVTKWYLAWPRWLPQE